MDQAIAAFSRRQRPAILESSLDVGGYGRFSILAADPIREVRADRVEGDELVGLLRQLNIARCDGPESLPFCGGWIGHISYEAGLGLERVPPVSRGRLDVPDVHLSLYDTVAVFDHLADRWHIGALDWDERAPVSRPPARERLDQISAFLREAATNSREVIEGVLPRNKQVILRPALTRSAYLDSIRRVQRHILEGDVYQVNLTERWAAATIRSPLDIYLRLRKLSPSPYAAFLQSSEATIISSSPELFLQVRGGQVITRPIKGTRPRGSDRDTDQVQRTELESSEKDRAELNMIVDVLRNDLGRVCEYGSIRVGSPGEIETHPTVFHRVATIEGRLREATNVGDLLRATFPGGSITGAPKIRAMQLISKLEPTPRGVYCGAMGWIGLDGSLALNLAIRTIALAGGIAYLHAGGGIVADSDPEAEYDEMLAKLQATAQAVGATIQDRG